MLSPIPSTPLRLRVPRSRLGLSRIGGGARGARAGNRVVFVNSISMGLPGLGHKDLWPRVARKMRSYAKLARRTEEGITVVSPAALPFFGSRAARAANRHLLSAQLRVLARRRGLERPILWVA